MPGPNPNMNTFWVTALLLRLLIFLLVILYAALWRVFQKAGKPGWAALVPFYNIAVLVQLAGKPGWWAAVIILVPVANIVFLCRLFMALARSFGKSRLDQ